MLHRLSRWFLLLSLPVGILTTTLPARSAQNLSLVYGPFQRSVPMSEVSSFAETGQATGRLQALLRLVPKNEQEELLKALRLKLPIGVVQVNKLLNSPIGKQVVDKVSPVILRRDKAGSFAISGALLTAAASKDGLGLLSFLEFYPAETIEVDLRGISKLFNETEGLGALLGGALGR